MQGRKQRLQEMASLRLIRTRCHQCSGALLLIWLRSTIAMHSIEGNSATPTLTCKVNTMSQNKPIDKHKKGRRGHFKHHEHDNLLSDGKVTSNGRRKAISLRITVQGSGRKAPLLGHNVETS
jgi:hypothetical protein